MTIQIEAIAQAFLSWQWAVHAFCLFLILSIRIFRLRNFFELFGTAILLFIVALGNAINVELTLAASPNALTLSMTMGLKALALVSLVVYGSIAANLVVVAVTHDEPKA